MKKNLLIIALILSLFTFSNAKTFALDAKDYKEIVKTTKTLHKLCEKNQLSEVAKYISENYKSFDGYSKKEMLEIYDMAYKLYPDTKSKETIKEVEEKNGLVKVYIDEVSNNNLTIEGEDATYASSKKVKGKMTTNASYAMIYKKEEDGIWRVISDEIYDEITDIRYGEAIKAFFEMDAPKTVKAGGEFTVKTTINPPEGRFVVGSIGHDKIIFPPEKYYDPYRAIDKTGALERVMVANKDGKNEYASSTFAFISTCSGKKQKISTQKAAISGMGIYVKRINLEENVSNL